MNNIFRQTAAANSSGINHIYAAPRDDLHHTDLMSIVVLTCFGTSAQSLVYVEWNMFASWPDLDNDDGYVYDIGS